MSNTEIAWFLAVCWSMAVIPWIAVTISKSLYKRRLAPAKSVSFLSSKQTITSILEAAKREMRRITGKNQTQGNDG